VVLAEVMIRGCILSQPARACHPPYQCRQSRRHCCCSGSNTQRSWLRCRQRWLRSSSASMKAWNAPPRLASCMKSVCCPLTANGMHVDVYTCMPLMGYCQSYHCLAGALSNQCVLPNRPSQAAEDVGCPAAAAARAARPAACAAPGGTVCMRCAVAAAAARVAPAATGAEAGHGSCCGLRVCNALRGLACLAALLCCAAEHAVLTPHKHTRLAHHA
jgi:hypothetical protein